MNARKDAAAAVLYLGMAVTMVGGAPWPAPRWWLVGAGLAVIAAGVAAKRAADRRAPDESAASPDGPYRAAGEPGTEGGAPGTIRSARVALSALVTRLRALAAEAEGRDLAGLVPAIEELLARGVDPVAAAQDDIVRLHGFAGYATMMAPLATGERMLHRAWSAASDGHRPETLASIQQAVPFVEEAEQALKALAG